MKSLEEDNPMLEQLSASVNLIVRQTQANFPTLLKLLALPWGVYLLTRLSGNRLLYLGIIPRRLSGLPGIAFAPFLHANFNHLFFNSIPLLVLSDFLLIQGLPYFLTVTLYIMLISGTLIWCFAKSGLHIGASALITGYWSYLICGLFKQATLTTFILGILSLYYFAGIFLGIFPTKKGVSWEGHLFGLMAGIATYYLHLHAFF